MPQYLLIGLCEPESPDGQAAFEQWFIDQHIEDTAHCPGFIRGRVYQLKGPHLDIETVSNYISVYEVEADSYEQAERILNQWQADPNAWAGRAHHRATGERFGGVPMKIRGSGWYELLRSFDGPAAKQDRQ